MLNEKQRGELIEAARAARKGAYAPYSNYAVGAALLSKKGQVYIGANVENAAYPDSICAERVAVFNAVNAQDREFEAIAVVTENGGTPCGSCRQVLAEFGLDTLVLIADEGGNVVEENTVRGLLPGSFGPGDLPASK